MYVLKFVNPLFVFKRILVDIKKYCTKKHFKLILKIINEMFLIDSLELIGKNKLKFDEK